MGTPEMKLGKPSDSWLAWAGAGRSPAGRSPQGGAMRIITIHTQNISLEARTTHRALIRGNTFSKRHLSLPTKVCSHDDTKAFSCNREECLRALVAITEQRTYDLKALSLVHRLDITKCCQITDSFVILSGTRRLDITQLPPKSMRIFEGVMEKKALASKGYKWQVGHVPPCVTCASNVSGSTAACLTYESL
jgi:hypothetical protein